jgi:hypothetical protein
MPGQETTHSRTRFCCLFAVNEITGGAPTVRSSGAPLHFHRKRARASRNSAARFPGRQRRLRQLQNDARKAHIGIGSGVPTSVPKRGPRTIIRQPIATAIRSLLAARGRHRRRRTADNSGQRRSARAGIMVSNRGPSYFQRHREQNVLYADAVAPQHDDRRIRRGALTESNRRRLLSGWTMRRLHQHGKGQDDGPCAAVSCNGREVHVGGATTPLTR